MVEGKLQPKEVGYTNKNTDNWWSHRQVPKKKKMHKLTSPTMKTKLTGDSNNWSLISINVNGFNSPIKRHRLKDWIWKQNPSFFCRQKIHLSLKYRHHLRVKGWEKKIFQSNGLKKQAGVAILTSNKIDFKLKSIKRD